MTQAPSRIPGPMADARPQANIYTVLLLVAIVALVVAIGIVLYNLTAPLPNGYGLTLKQVFQGGELPK